YFDTDDLVYFRSSADGVGRRLRIREYALAPDFHTPPVLTGTCFLELKQQSGEARSKLRISAPPEVLARIVAGPGGGGGNGGPIGGGGGSADALEENVAIRALHEELREPEVPPRFGTWYRRTAFRGETARVRITLDEGLTFFRPGPM